MPDTTTDVFHKARTHERLAQLVAAREADLLPYFRVVEGPARPVMEMEGAPRIMLGSNNYLGLTADERVVGVHPRGDLALELDVPSRRSTRTAPASRGRACSTARSPRTSSSSARSPRGWTPTTR
jgi:hypothetical protein